MCSLCLVCMSHTLLHILYCQIDEFTNGIVSHTALQMPLPAVQVPKGAGRFLHRPVDLDVNPQHRSRFIITSSPSPVLARAEKDRW